MAKSAKRVAYPEHCSLLSPLSPSVHRPRKTGRFVGLQVSQFKCLHCLAATKLVWPLPKGEGGNFQKQLLRCVNQQMSAERERERQREGKRERGERESVKCKLQVLSHTSTHPHIRIQRETLSTWTPNESRIKYLFVSKFTEVCTAPRTPLSPFNEPN